ncbi:GntR family transcriptional regulator [Microbacterium pseudoresistens]|uniref:DNA-binding GntR family transcriptional regulator n=1 Tax=Microbacterium pseudoresistens TaxID=640634 RepID=A0A7Y9EUP0_9MICO|nr:GntR family transcriptional regulator [Microbacterium pseudoresistens]NYD54243.1 DNA-binding GntR family transcriptional regulator [Microbacterium pseudoresistens]
MDARAGGRAAKGPQNLKQEVAKFLRDEIFSGALTPGARIDQDALAESIGVSRLPVREALITLEMEGMVTNVPRRGSFVAPLAPDDIRDHFEMYGVLSGVAAARAAASPSDSLIDELAATSDLMRRGTDPVELDTLNFRFHRLLNRAGGSRRLLSVLRLLSDNMPTHFFTSNNEWEFRERTFDEHDRIVDAVRNRDSSAVAAAVVEHFRHVGEQAVRSLTAVGFWNEPIGNRGNGASDKTALDVDII